MQLHCKTVHVTSLCDDFVEVRPSKFGKGLFAGQKISANSVICKISGKLIAFEETLQLGEKESHAIQIDIDQ